MTSSGYLWDTVSAAAARRPDARAVLEHGTWTLYAELLVRAKKQAHVMAAQGVTPATVVTVTVPKSTAALAALLGLSKLGATAFIPAENTAPDLLARVSDQVGASHRLQPGKQTEDGEVTVRLTPQQPGQSEPLPAGTALVLTTSGSTGLPKLVELPSTAIGNFVDWAQDALGLGPSTVSFSYAPLNFDLSLLDVWAVLACGGSCALADAGTAAAPRALADLMIAARPTLVQAVPLLPRLLARVLDLVADSVETLVLTGDAFPVDLWPALQRTFPNAAIFNLYGATETNDSFIHEVSAHDIDRGSVPIGRPLPGVRALVVDQDDQEVQDPAAGQLIVRTPFQATGYVGADGSESPFHARAGADGDFYRTGDLAFRDEGGTFHLLGRASRVVKVRGVRTNLDQVEEVINAHPRVAEAVVFPLPDLEDGGFQLHAAIEANDAAEPVDTLALRQHCLGRLPLSSVPTRYHALHTLPRAANGKVDRKTITSLLHPQESA